MENTLTMLHHEEPENVVTPPGQDVTLPAAQVRVTAEEFARAVTRHQARREAAAQHLEGTVSLGDAVQELNIDITPEELLAEVQAARLEQQQATLVVPQTRRPRWGLLTAGAGLLAVLTVGLYDVRSGPASVTSATVVIAPVQDTSGGVPITAPGTILVQDNSAKAPVLRTLQEIPNGVPVRCGLTQTDGHTTLADFSNPNSAWTLIKHNGQLYIRGWIPNMSAQAIQTNGVTLYDTRALVPSGAAPTKVSLRLGSIQAVPGQGDDEMIVAQKVQPDSHFGDRW